MGATVYTSDAGRRFHFERACQALRSGQDLWDWDCDDYCRHDHRSARAVRQRSNLGAALLGYTACRVCMPPALALPATGETFGHEPIEYDGVPICRRCYTERRPRLCPWSVPLRAPVPWPCTSAVVLGLAPRPENDWGLMA